MALFPLQDKTFNRWLVGLFLAAVAAIAAFNLVINPFAVFPVARIAGISDVHNMTNARLYKTFLLRQREVDGLLLGSSRVEESMYPLAAAWPGMTVYNMAMPGCSLHEMLRNLQHAHALTPLKQVMIGLDFFMFSAYQEVASDFSEDNFAVEADGTPKPPTYVLRTWANILFSADGLEKSRDTLKASRKRAMPTHEDNGMTYIPLHESVVHDNAAIYRIFDSFENNYFRKNSFWLNGPNSTYTTVKNVATGATTYDNLRALLDYIYANNINAHFVISPIHVRMLLGLDGIGLWPAFSDWKLQLTRINEEVAARHGQPPRPLWDFTLVNDHTTEWLPEDPRLPQPKKGLAWFWDPAHPKPSFGNLVQEKVFITHQEDAIGVRLHSNTVQAHLQQQRAALDAYKEQDPLTRDAIRQRLESLNTWQWIKP